MNPEILINIPRWKRNYIVVILYYTKYYTIFKIKVVKTSIINYNLNNIHIQFNNNIKISFLF